MKKFFFLGAALTMAIGMSSCRSSESAYKKAYEKAQQNAATTVVTTPVASTTTTTQVTTTPVTTTPTTTVTPVQDYSNVAVRTENVSLVSGGALKAYSVVVASMSVPANATALANKLTSDVISRVS